jgi:hypothetical protein
MKSLNIQGHIFGKKISSPFVCGYDYLDFLCTFEGFHEGIILNYKNIY